MHMSYKICTMCHKRKHVGKSFYKDSGQKSGVHPSCKDCNRARTGIKKRLPKERKNKQGDIVRRCSTCEVYKLKEKFYRNPATNDGIHHQCKSCSIKGARSEASKIGRNGRRQRERMIALIAYSGGKPLCRCCGEIRYEFLCIDHINGGGGRHRKQVGTNFYRWLAKNGFPKGFQVLCHNCNMAKGFYGKCPHETNTTGT